MGCGASRPPPPPPLDANGEPVAARKTTPQDLMGEFLVTKIRAPIRAGSVGELRSIIDELQENAADLDYADAEKGWTAFHYACDRGELEKVMLLVHAGCDTGRPTPAGQTGWERAQQYSHRAPTEKIQRGCEGVSGFLESVARKGMHVNLRFEWGRQMIAEGSKFEEERQWTSAHSAYKVGAARLNHRSNQLNARAKVLLLAAIGRFGAAPEPEPEPQVVSVESADRVPVPTWVHPAQRAALRQVLFDGVHSGAAKEAEKRAAELREKNVARIKAKEQEKQDKLTQQFEHQQAKEKARLQAKAATEAEREMNSAMREMGAVERAEAEALGAAIDDEDSEARRANAAARKAEQEAKEAELRKPHTEKELNGLKMTELMVIAAHAGASDEDIEVACETESGFGPKAAVITLYFEAVDRAEIARVEEVARVAAEEEVLRAAAAVVAAERAAVRADALEKQQARAAARQAEAERLQEIATAEERAVAARAQLALQAEVDRVAREKRRGWWEEEGVTHIRGLAFLRAIDEWGFQEVNAGNGITEEDVADMPALENLAERRRRRQRIRDADASARSTLRELFLSSWGGQPIEGTVTLPELYEYANEWLLPAPPLIESEAATAIAQLSPNMASVPAELLHCLQRVEEHLREDQAKVFSQTLMDQQRQMAEWTARLYGGGGQAPVPQQHPVIEWAAALAPNSKYKALADATPKNLGWQPLRSPDPTMSMPKAMKKLPPLKPPERLVANLDKRLQNA